MLKLIGEKMVEFRVGLKSWWDSTTGKMEEVTDPGVKLDIDEQVESAGEDEDEGGGDGDEDVDDDAISE